MSSGPSEPGPPRRGFEPWRKVALAGAVILLANAIARAVLKADMPVLAFHVANAIGFVTVMSSLTVRARSERSGGGDDPDE